MMTVAVVGLHFSGMAAIRLIPARLHTEAMLLSPA
jgi:NO-binding membrane sensor protein with MHYT domain